MRRRLALLRVRRQEGAPGVATDNAVDHEPMVVLERAHRGLGGFAEIAILFDAKEPLQLAHPIAMVAALELRLRDDLPARLRRLHRPRADVVSERRLALDGDMQMLGVIVRPFVAGPPFPVLDIRVGDATGVDEIGNPLVVRRDDIVRDLLHVHAMRGVLGDIERMHHAGGIRVVIGDARRMRLIADPAIVRGVAVGRDRVDLVAQFLQRFGKPCHQGGSSVYGRNTSLCSL